MLSLELLKKCRLLEKELLKDGPLFGDYKKVPWLISPSWFELSINQIRELKNLGYLLWRFIKAYNDLYYEDEKTARLIEQGKPEKIIILQRKFQKEIPLLIRADIVLTENGFKITEIEIIVGEMGLNSKVKEAYTDIIPASRFYQGSIVNSFLRVVENITDKKILLVPSFSSRYLPELRILAKLCQKKGYDIEAMSPEEVKKSLKAGMIWRLFEAYEWDKIDLPEIPIYPPLKQFMEEKIWMALLHHQDYRNYWENRLGKDFHLLKEYIPPTWILRKDYLPLSFSKLASLGRKKRHYITKLSGYSEKSWEGKSFIYWGESSNKKWKDFLFKAIKGKELYILQEFQDSKRYSLPVLVNGKIKQVDNLRTRLTPFYFRVGNKIEMSEIIIVLRKSKKVHVSTDSIRIPVAISH